ncbi:MAG TPA: hypothetical protein VLE93_00645 [Candidatus Saccharimonadales bacterium]|nr:hypothetical protein [Candidatus Saccharimonadales bacterium]
MNPLKSTFSLFGCQRLKLAVGREAFHHLAYLIQSRDAQRGSYNFQWTDLGVYSTTLDDDMSELIAGNPVNESATPQTVEFWQMLEAHAQGATGLGAYPFIGLIASYAYLAKTVAASWEITEQQLGRSKKVGDAFRSLGLAADQPPTVLDKELDFIQTLLGKFVAVPT